MRLIFKRKSELRNTDFLLIIVKDHMSSFYKEKPSSSLIFFSETLRKYPTVPILSRECTKDDKIPDKDVVLEKRMTTVIPVLALHHDPKYYPEPERFDPERFTEDEKAKRHHYVYLPFGEGPRICIGTFEVLYLI